MADQFLLSHRVAPGVFELSGLRTTSIRDQMLRAHLLADRLHDTGLIGRHRALLVIGGGAGGVTAAMRAATLGVHVRVYEERPDLFYRQTTCDRRLDPTEYDWPMSHWDRGAYPVAGPPSWPLRFARDSASMLAHRWAGDFRFWNGARPRVDVRQARILPQHVRSSPPNAIDVHDPLTHALDRFGAAISCVGFPEERCAVPVLDAQGQQERYPSGNPVPDYVGFAFWDRDPFDLPDLGLGTRADPIRVLISGGGDGALQDFIRVLTGKTARELHDAFFATPPDPAPFLRADAVAQRAFCWLPEKQSGGLPAGHATLEQWHRAYDAEADRIYTAWQLTGHDRALRGLLRAGVRATLLHPCTHFDFCYGLNRLLVLLLARLHRDDLGAAGVAPIHGPLLHSNSLAGVRPLGTSHRCGLGPRACHGEPHEAFARAADCARATGSGVATFVLDEFDVIIVRHGVVRSPFFAEAPFSRQLVPFHLPA